MTGEYPKNDDEQRHGKRHDFWRSKTTTTSKRDLVSILDSRQVEFFSTVPWSQAKNYHPRGSVLPFSASSHFEYSDTNSEYLVLKKRSSLPLYQKWKYPILDEGLHFQRCPNWPIISLYQRTHSNIKWIPCFQKSCLWQLAWHGLLADRLSNPKYCS